VDPLKRFHCDARHGEEDDSGDDAQIRAKVDVSFTFGVCFDRRQLKILR
jgi:hypothetical protein